MQQLKNILAICIPILFIFALTIAKNKTIDWSNTLIGKLIIICIILFYAEMNLTYGFLALMFTVFYFRIFFSIERADIMNNEPAGVVISNRTSTKVKPANIKVPLVIYQTWHTKELPPKMKECVEKLKRDNPEFEHHLYDVKDCRDFIKMNFSKEILETYDSLVPISYKSDLWRYCILYKKGGVYLDIKYQCENGFKLLEMTYENETFVLDRPYGNSNISFEKEVDIFNKPNFYNFVKPMITDWKNKEIGVFTNPLVSVPENPIFMECIQQIVKNVKNGYYGFNSLYPTGPGLIGEKYFKKDFENKIHKFKYFNSINGTYIMDKKRKILSHYPEYRQEQKEYGEKNKNGVKYYSVLWNENGIYKNINVAVKQVPPKRK
jgi:mannosyltransferase OCH1-like enzyme